MPYRHSLALSPYHWTAASSKSSTDGYLPSRGHLLATFSPGLVPLHLQGNLVEEVEANPSTMGDGMNDHLYVLMMTPFEQETGGKASESKNQQDRYIASNLLPPFPKLIAFLCITQYNQATK